MSNYIFNDANKFLEIIKENLHDSKRYCFATAYFDIRTFEKYHQTLKKFMTQPESQAVFLVSSKVDIDTYNMIRAGKLDQKDEFKSTAQRIGLKEEVVMDIFNWIKQEKLIVKFAITSQNGIFHIKLGYILKNNGDWISWSGSLNHTTSALMGNNVEQISFYESLENSQHGKRNIETFDNILNGWHKDILLFNANDVLIEELIKYSEIKDTETFRKIKYEIMMEQYDFILDTENNKTLFAVSKEEFNPYFDLPQAEMEEVDEYRVNFQTMNDLTTILKFVSEDKRWYITPEAKMVLNKSIANIEQKLYFGKEIKNVWTNFLYSTNDSKLMQDFINFYKKSRKGMIREPQKLQILQAFYSYKMQKSMNFSVPGTGKTMTSLTTFNAWKEENVVNRIIVISPTSAFQPWIEEWRETFGFEPNVLSLSSINGMDAKYQNIIDMNMEKYDLVLMHFATAAKYNKELSKQIKPTDLIVVDEAHYVKNFYGSWGKSISNLVEVSKFSISLTGTPAPNGPDDINNLIKMTYGSEYLNFIRKYENLENAISPLFVKVDYQDLEMKWKQSINFHNFELSNEQLILEEYLNKKLKCNSEYGYLFYYINMMQLYTSHEAVTHSKDSNNQENYTELVSNNFSTITSPKLTELSRIVERNKNKNILIWTVFINSMQSVYNELSDLGVPIYIYNGQKTEEERQKIISLYKENGGILIANAKTLAESVSLHHNTDLTIYFEYTLSLSELLQSMNRTYRYGNTKDSEYIFLQSKNGMKFDQKMYEVLMNKKETQENIVDSKEINEEDFLSLNDQIKEFIGGL